MVSNLLKKTVCLIVILAMVLGTLSVVPLGFAGRGIETYSIDGMVMYRKPSNDAPIEEATVILYNLHTGERITNTTDGNGYYLFEGVAPGSYQVIAKPPNNNYLTIEEGENDSKSGIIEVVDEDESVDPLFLQKVPLPPQPIYKLQGYIMDNFSVAIANTTVILKSLDFPGYEISSKMTNETGEYSINSFRGWYELWIILDEYQYYIEDFNLNQTVISNHNITLNNSEPSISGYLDKNVKSKDIRDAFLYDIDNDKYIHRQFSGNFFTIPAYYGNFKLIIDIPGYQPYYHPDIITLSVSTNSVQLPGYLPLKLTNKEKIVSTITFRNNDWNKIHIKRVWTLNHDSELFGLKFVDYGDPVTIGCPRFQIDNEPGFGGTQNGTVESLEVDAFEAWLKERGPYHQNTHFIKDGNEVNYFDINNTYFTWKNTTFKVTTSGFEGDYDSTDAMVITTNLDFDHLPKNDPLDSTKYKIRFNNLQENEVIVFNLPTGFELSDVDTYDSDIVWVRAYNKCQINGSATIYAEKMKDPTAIFEVKKDDYVKGMENITFNASQSLAGSGKIIDYLWDFDDGTTDSGVAIERNYSKPGIYNVTLTVVTQADLDDLAWQEITVDTVNPEGKIVFQNETGVTIQEGEENNGSEKFIIRFNATKSRDTIDGFIPGKIVRYEWLFGDESGNKASGAVANHSYENPGTYEVSLNLTDAAGNWEVFTKKIKILDVEPPEPAFKPEPGGIRIVHINKWLILNGTITKDNFDPVENLTFSWDLDLTTDSDGDGNESNDVDSTEPIVNFTPKRTGPYPIALKVTDKSDNIGDSRNLPPEDWTIDVMGTNLRFAPIQEEINKYIEVSEDKPKEGEKVKFTVNVSNSNEVTAWDVIVKFFVDGKQKASKSIKQIPEGGFELLKFSWKASGANKKHNISFNVSLENETWEQSWDDNYRSMYIEPVPDTWIDTPCLVAIIVIVIVVVVVGIYFYRRRREEIAELGRKRGKGKGKGKGKEKGKEKSKKSKDKD